MLTPRTHQTFKFIEKYIADHDGISPAFSEILDGVGFGSKSEVHRVLDTLMERGFIFKEFGKPRSIRILRAANDDTNQEIELHGVANKLLADIYDQPGFSHSLSRDIRNRVRVYLYSQQKNTIPKQHGRG